MHATSEDETGNLLGMNYTSLDYIIYFCQKIRVAQKAKPENVLPLQRHI